MRKFKLINSEGGTWDLNVFTSFFHAIGGFGFREITQYERIGSDFIPLEELFAQGEMTGKILFGGREAYAAYRKFSRFVRAAPLTLVYETNETYRIPVRLTELGKTELMNGGSGLLCNATFLATGLYYKKVSMQSGTVTVGGKIYDYAYPYTYENVSPNTVAIESDSYEDSPCRIIIFGACVNPAWKHYVNNTLVATGKYEGTVLAGNRLVIDSTSIPYSIMEQNAIGETIANRYQFCDFTTERFFHLKHGNNRISVSHDGLNEVKMIVEGRISYETV